MAKPNGMLNDRRRESTSFIDVVHRDMLPEGHLISQYLVYKELHKSLPVPRWCFLLLGFVLSAGCGGGGGGGGGGGTPAPTPTPTVTISSSPSSASVNSAVTISWSSMNASSCTASGAWSGSKATSGRLLSPPCIPSNSEISSESGALPLPRLAGVTHTRYLLFGANTPWNRVRFTLGLGTRAASLAMKSTGSKMT